MVRLLLALLVAIVLAAILLGVLRAVAAVRSAPRGKVARHGGDARLARAWEEAATLAGAADHRVARARESCDALLAAAARAPFEPALRDCAALIAEIVPDLVAIGRAEAAAPPSPARGERIEEMVDLLDRLGDEADRVRARRALAAGSPFAAHRAYLDARRREAE